MVSVLRARGRKDEEIVKVYNQGDIQEVSKDRVHESLEGRWGVGEAEWHDEEFEGAVTCAEGCLPLIPVFNAQQVIGIMSILVNTDALPSRSRRSLMRGSR